MSWWFIDENESPLEAGQRELLEETGYQAKTLEIMGSAYPYPGISPQKTFYIRARQATWACPPQLEKSEIIRTVLKSEQELNQIFKQKMELDGTLCTALFFNYQTNKN